MSGLPDFNYPSFRAAETKLRQQGFEPVNPVNNGLPAEAPWQQHMRADIALLVTCEAIVMLPGWRQSRGACLEHHIAKRLGMDVIHWPTEEVRAV